MRFKTMLALCLAALGAGACKDDNGITDPTKLAPAATIRFINAVVDTGTVDYINNSSTGTWSGEEVALPRDLVSGVTERRFSRGRTWLTVGVTVAAMALATTIVIKGFGADPGGTKTTDGGGQQQ